MQPSNYVLGRYHTLLHEIPKLEVKYAKQKWWHPLVFGFLVVLFFRSLDFILLFWDGWDQVLQAFLTRRNLVSSLLLWSVFSLMFQWKFDLKQKRKEMAKLIKKYPSLATGSNETTNTTAS